MHPAPDLNTTAMFPVSGAAAVALFCVLATALYYDLKESRIPNWLTFPSMGFGLMLASAHGAESLKTSALGLGVGAVILFVFFMFGGMGGGDVKLMGAVGAFLGSQHIQAAVVYTSIVGAALTLVILVWRADFWARLRYLARKMCRRASAPDMAVPASALSVPVPYAVAISAGTLMALLLNPQH